MFRATHLSCSEAGQLILDRLDHATLLDTYDHDLGTAGEPNWPPDLGSVPEWFWPEVIALYQAWQGWLYGRTG